MSYQPPHPDPTEVDDENFGHHVKDERTVEEIAAGFEAQIEADRLQWHRIFGDPLPLRTEQELRNAQHVETPEIPEETQ